MTPALDLRPRPIIALALLLLAAPACRPTTAPAPNAQPSDTPAPALAVPALPFFSWSDCTFIARDEAGIAPELVRSLPCELTMAAGTPTALQTAFSSPALRLEIQQARAELRVRDETGLEVGGEAAQGDIQGCWRAIVGADEPADTTDGTGNRLHVTAVEFDLRWCEGGDGMVLVRRARTPQGVRVIEVRAPGQAP